MSHHKTILLTAQHMDLCRQFPTLHVYLYICIYSNPNMHIYLVKSDQPIHSKTLRLLGSERPIYLTPSLNRVPLEFATHMRVLVWPWKIEPPKGLNSRPGMALMLRQVLLPNTSQKPKQLWSGRLIYLTYPTGMGEKFSLTNHITMNKQATQKKHNQI